MRYSSQFICILFTLLLSNSIVFSNRFNSIQLLDDEVDSNQNQTNWRPTVLMHGVLSHAESMDYLAGWIRQDFPGIFVANIEIGDGRLDSVFMDINEQVEIFAATVKNISELSNGFNLIGHSQGGLITRAYIERYNDPPVYNYISLAGPQDGVFGTPFVNSLCPDDDCPWLVYFVDLVLEGGWVNEDVQESFSFAAYWKDPFQIDLYLKTNIFLADINNERSVNETYRNNILSLNEILLVYSESDEVVIPMQSPWFYFYSNGSDSEITPFNQSLQYTEDLLGLHKMYDLGKINFAGFNCSHTEICKPICYSNYVEYTRPMLNNTLNM